MKTGGAVVLVQWAMKDNFALRRDRFTTVSLTVVCQSFQALSLAGIALLLPMIRQDLGLSFTQGGTLAAAATLVYAFMQLPAGFLCDVFSPKRLFVIGALGCTILAITFGLVTNYWQALANQALTGFFRALLFAPGIALITGWFPSQRRATATGLYLVGGAMGNILFSLVGPALVGKFDWRFAFLSMGPIGVVAVLFLYRYGKESPDKVERHKVDIMDGLQLFRYKIIWLCATIQYIRLWTMQGITFWLPSFLFLEKDLRLEVIGVIVAVQTTIMAPSNIIGGYISDRMKKPILVIGVSLLCLAVTTISLALVKNMPLTVLTILINALFLQMYFGPLFSVPVEAVGANRAGLCNGFCNFFANLGGLSSVFILGALKDYTGSFKLGFVTISAACLIGMALTLFLGRQLRYQRNQIATAA
ncbi:MAG: MFS transporter [Chloroflexi bacterium]|nr:MFS transporter [Chloroflexota bacterium]